MSSKKAKKKGHFNIVHDIYNNALQEEIEAAKRRAKAADEFVNACVDQYKEPESRKSLIENGKYLCYSQKKLAQIEEHFSAWNRDEVDINIAEEIYELQIYVDERIEKKPKSFLNIFVDSVFFENSNESGNNNGI